jgi:Domain of unknown function (DUF1877)
MDPMGMVVCLVALPPEKLDELKADEDLIEAFLYPDDGESEPENSIDLDKAWHGIHYLLTGEAEGGEPPFSLAVVGGEFFGPEIGLEPPSFLTSTQVNAVASAISALSSEELRTRFNAKDMEAKDIYPDVIWVRDGAEALDYLIENYEPLVEFYRDAASRGDAVIKWLC